MKTILLKTDTSYDVLPELRKIMEDSWEPVEVRMDYNTRKLPSLDDISSYPVTLIFDDAGEGVEVKIMSLSVGYGGAGPTDFSKILKYFEIPYEKDDIFTKKKMDSEGYIRLVYIR